MGCALIGSGSRLYFNGLPGTTAVETTFSFLQMPTTYRVRYWTGQGAKPDDGFQHNRDSLGNRIWVHWVTVRLSGVPISLITQMCFLRPANASYYSSGKIFCLPTDADRFNFENCSISLFSRCQFKVFLIDWAHPRFQKKPACQSLFLSRKKQEHKVSCVRL